MHGSTSPHRSPHMSPHGSSSMHEHEPMSGKSRSRPAIDAPNDSPAPTRLEPMLAAEAPTLPKSAPAIAPSTSTPAAPPTAYLASLMDLPDLRAASMLACLALVVSNAHIFVWTLGTPYCTERATTSSSRIASRCSQALPVSRSIRCLMNTLSRGTSSALLPRSSMTCIRLLHSWPLANRPLISTTGGSPPWIFPETITGDPTNRSGTGNG
mmetsp:Transcript_31919/g.80293  ORF Transcript_31919/g.80293 Transcript_31919/m.80293 type:complete len:211 (+) Transcript_31919:496-1128(+)